MLGRRKKKTQRLHHEDPGVRLQELASAALDDEEQREQVIQLAREDPDVDVRCKAVARLDAEPVLLSLLDDCAPVAQAAAERLVSLIRAGAMPPQPLPRLVIDAWVRTAVSSDLETLLANVTDAEHCAELAIRLRDDRTRVLAHPLLRTSSGLAVLEHVSRGRDKSCNRHARDALEHLKAEHTRAHSSLQRVQEIDRAVIKALEQPADTQAAQVAREQKLAKLARMRTAPIEELQQARAELRAGVADDELPEIPPDPLAGHDFTVAEVADPFAPLVDELRKLSKEIRSGGEPSSITARRNDVTERWLTAADVQAASASQHQTFERVSAQYRAWSTALAKLASLAERKTPAPLPAASAMESGVSLQSLLAERVAFERKWRRQQLRWPEEHTVPAELLAFEEDLGRVAGEIETLRRTIDSVREKLDQALTAAQAAIDEGRVKDSAEQLRKVREHHATIGGKLPPGDEQSVNRLSTQLNELKDWQKFATNPKREDLLEQLEALADSDFQPPRLAERLRNLRAEWQQLGHPDNPRARELQQRFDTLAEQVFAPCKAYYDAQATLRAENLERRQQLCAQLESYLAKTNWQDTDLRAAENILRTARIEWRQYHPCERKSLKAVQTRFDDLQQQLHEHIKAGWESNAQRKRDLIESARGLQDSDGALEDRLDEAKRLQRQWRSIGPVPRKLDQPLWAEFRQVCDALFELRDVAVAEQRAQADQTRARRQRKREQRLQLYQDLEKWDAELALAERAGEIEGREAPHPWFDRRTAGDAQVADWLKLTLEAEIAADVSSPPEDQQRRLELQVDMINRGKRSFTAQELEALLEQWCSGGPKDAVADALRTRFFAAVLRGLEAKR